jgi:hypothetical protein
VTGFIETVELLVEAFKIGDDPLVISDPAHRISASSTPFGHQSILASRQRTILIAILVRSGTMQLCV